VLLDLEVLAAERVLHAKEAALEATANYEAATALVGE
jgi:hypothetical protein